MTPASDAPVSVPNRTSPPSPVASATSPVPGTDERSGLAVAAGFGVAASVWVVAFAGRIPDLTPYVSGPMLLAAFGLVMLGSAAWIGARLGWTRAVLALATAGLVNVLLFGSVVNAGQMEYAPDEVDPGGLWWIPGSVLAATMLGAVGGLLGDGIRMLLGGERPRARRGPFVWTGPGLLALVTMGTYAVLVSVGALVTSMEAGLAVPDWPTSQGYQMFLYPFTRMVGGIYYEHAHRLIGSLVGLETLVLAAWLGLRLLRQPGGLVSRRHALVGLGALVLVIIQGTLGGQRVIQVADLGHEGALWFAVAHACTAQIFLLVLAGLAFMLLRRPRLEGAAATAPAAGPGRRVRGYSSIEVATGGVLVGVLVLQTLMGAILRHHVYDWALLAHLGGAVAAGLVALVLIVMVMGGPEFPGPQRIALALMGVIAVQILLGAAAWWITTRYDAITQSTSYFMSTVTAAHVVTGAATLLAAWWLTLEVGARRPRSGVVTEADPRIALPDGVTPAAAG